MGPLVESQEEVIITAQDFIIFGKRLEDDLKRFFPFESLVFYIGPREDLKSFFYHVNISKRQEQRALLALENEKPFWDRVQHQIFIPINLLKNGYLPIAHLKNVPKTIGAEEGEWFINLISYVLSNNLAQLKYRSKARDDFGVPEYIKRFLKSHKKEPILLYLELNNGDVSFDSIDNVIGCLWGKKSPELILTSRKALWFLCQKNKDNNEKLYQLHKKTALYFSKTGPSFNAFYLFKAKDDEELRKYFLLARLFKARVFSSLFVEKIKKDTGVDLLKIAGLENSNKKDIASCVLKLSDEDLKAALKKRCKDFGIDLISAGKDCFVFALSKRFGLSSQNYLEKIRAIFLELKEVDDGIIAGFATSYQLAITANNLFVSSFLAFYHAWLLGRGNYACFDSITFNVYGDLLYAQGDIKGAISIYKKGLQLNSVDINLLNSLGALYAELGRLSKAEEFFLKVQEIEANNAMAAYNLSGIYLKKRQLRKALDQIDKALKHAEDNLPFFVRKLEILLEQGEYRQALDLSEPLLDRSSERPLYLLSLCAQAYFFMNKWQNAKEIFKKILKKNSSSPLALLFLAYGFWKYEKDRNSAFRMIKELNPDVLTQTRYKEIYKRLIAETKRN